MTPRARTPGRDRLARVDAPRDGSRLEALLAARRLAGQADPARNTDAEAETPTVTWGVPTPSNGRTSRLRQVAGQARSAAARFRHREQLMSQAIESRLAEQCPEIQRAFVSAPGDDGRFALLAMDPERLGDRAKQEGIADDFAALTRSTVCHQLVSRAILTVNAELGVGNAITTVTVLDHPLESGALEHHLVPHEYRALLPEAAVTSGLSGSTPA